MRLTNPSFEKIRCLDIPLADKLAAYADHINDNEASLSAVYSALVDRLLAVNAGARAPKVNAVLPRFLLPDNEGRLVSSAELLNSGPLVVSFNRGHWCSFCRLELLALADVYPEIKRRGGELVSIMPERATQIRELRETFELPFRILTDIDNGYALACGLMVPLGSAVRELYLRRGTDLPEYQGNGAFFVPIPATYTAGPDGRIIGRFVDPDFTHRMAPDEILKCLGQNG